MPPADLSSLSSLSAVPQTMNVQVTKLVSTESVEILVNAVQVSASQSTEHFEWSTFKDKLSKRTILMNRCQLSNHQPQANLHL
jgi:hypothetical protein